MLPAMMLTICEQARASGWRSIIIFTPVNVYNLFENYLHYAKAVPASYHCSINFFLQDFPENFDCH
jgi:hypothetical protein